ncbi:protein kinase domain-containing protein [Pseudophaeobacter leonis]|uniref:protein kinase domain-containing protein n=1 Tax=Pseudophaeobacter leonis TaxID=1144477 RepID=UPI0009F41E5A|nr:protein kinase [Pseudophaeobacter leonis]
MPATQEQIKWLKLASAKNPKKSKKKIMREYEDFERRRNRVEELLTGISYVGSNNPRGKLVEIVKAADEIAKGGDFKGAYDQLLLAKEMASIYIRKFPKSEAANNIRPKLELISHNFLERASIVDRFEATVRHVTETLKGLLPVSGAQTFEEAINRASRLAELEPELRASCYEFIANIPVNEKLSSFGYSQLEGLKVLIQAFELADKGHLVASEYALAQELTSIYEQYKDRFKPHDFQTLAEQALLKFELKVQDLKDTERMHALYQDENKGGDAQSQKAVSGLRKNSEHEVLRLEKEEDRLRLAQQQYLDLQDEFNTQTERDAVTPANGLDQFFIADVLSDLFSPDEMKETSNGSLFVSLSDKRLKEVKHYAVSRLTEHLAILDTDADEFFQLMAWQAPEYADRILQDVFNGSKISGVYDTCLEIGKALNAVACLHCPDQMSDDGHSLSFGGTDYVLDRILKSGGNARACRFVDPETNRTIVVKTSLNARDTGKVAIELENHRRLMNNLAPGGRAESGLVALEGLARSPDGLVHMILEDVQGGDLEDVAKTMSVLSDAGILPASARQILMCDVIVNTARAMKEMEASGLVHGDLKGENVMMTSDGRIKIIDFGESDFIDTHLGGADTRGATPGYVSPDLAQHPKHMDARADTFALGGMLQKLILTDTPRDGRTYSAGSMGKLIASLKETDRDNRPSLDAVMFNTLHASGAADFAQSDIEKLKEAMAETASMVSRIETQISADEIAQNMPNCGSVVSEGDVSLRKLKSLVGGLESKIVKLRNGARGDKASYLMSIKPEIAAYQQEIDFLNQKVKAAMKAKSVQAEMAFATALANPELKVRITLADQTGNIPLPRLYTERSVMVEKLDRLRHEFEQSLFPPDQADFEKAEGLSARIEKGEDNLRLLDDAVYAAVDEQAKFFLSQEKLKAVAKAFER